MVAADRKLQQGLWFVAFARTTEDYGETEPAGWVKTCVHFCMRG